MKLFLHVLIIIIYILLLGCILYYVYTKFKIKTESFENNAIKVLQIGFNNTEKTIKLSKLLNKHSFLLISTNEHETDKYNRHNIQAEILKTATNKLIDIFYYPIHEYSILYINIDVYTDSMLEFMKNHLINTKLEFNVILLNSSLPNTFLNIIKKKYIFYRKNIFIKKNYTMSSNPRLYEIVDSFSYND